MTDTQTPRPVSLAELRAAHSSIVRDDIPHVPCMDPSCTKTRGEHPKPLRDIYDALSALLDIAEAAQALDTALLHDAVAGVEAKLALDDLDEALAEVRP